MLKIQRLRCARHHRVYDFLIIFFRAICVVTLLSTACYIVDIRSRYRPLRRDFHALIEHSERLWIASSLPKPLVTAPKPHLPAIQSRGKPLSRNLNASFTRTGGATYGAVDDYSLEETECLWSAWLDPATTSSASPAPLIAFRVHLHVFFLHGNAGSHTQGEYWSCAMQYASNLLGVSVSTYAFQWVEQANVHRGRLVGLQADYVADAVEAVVRGATDDRVRHRVWFAAHSMGGVVARLAAQLLDPSIDFGGIVAFNSPHRFPPLLLDASMADVYRTLTFAEQSSAAVSLKSIKNDALATAAVSGAVSPVPLSSAALMEVCGVQTEDCLRHRRRQRRVPYLISITSGEMDLQIEPATTYPSQWWSRYAVSFFNTLDRATCMHTTSHDGILLSPCAVTVGALRLLSATLNESGSTSAPVEAEGVSVADVNAFAQLPLPPGVVSRASLVGQLLWRQHMWPWAVSALYGYVLFDGLWPQVVQSAEVLSQRWSTRHRKVCRFTPMLRWIVPSEFSVAVFLIFFYGCTGMYAMLTELYLMGAGQRAWYRATRPWQWEAYPQLRHTSASAVAPLQFAALTIVFVLTSIGPVTVGVSAGMALVLIGDAAGRVKARMGRCRWVLRTVRRRHTTAALFSVMLVGLYLALRGLGVDPTARAMMWVALFLVVPSFQQPQARQEDRRVAPAAADVELPQHGADAVEVRFPADFVAARLSAEGGSWHAQHLPGMLYAGVYMIQLHPFFTVRNAIVSHTLDDVSTVDARNYAVEGGLLVLLCCAATAPLLPVFRFRLMGCYVGVLSSAMSLSAVAWMLVHPVESFQVLPALLWCFPSFLLATLSVALS